MTHLQLLLRVLRPRPPSRATKGSLRRTTSHPIYIRFSAGHEAARNRIGTETGTGTGNPTSWQGPREKKKRTSIRERCIAASQCFPSRGPQLGNRSHSATCIPPTCHITSRLFAVSLRSTAIRPRLAKTAKTEAGTPRPRTYNCVHHWPIRTARPPCHAWLWSPAVFVTGTTSVDDHLRRILPLAWSA